MTLIHLKKDLGQVLTPTCVADLLTKEICLLESNFNKVVDLGAGTGILTKSLQSRAIGKFYEIYEIDPTLVEVLNNDKFLKQAQIFNQDVFNINLNNYDLIVSNPPFVQFKKNNIGEYGDILFLEKMWGEIKDGAIFSFIVTNNFISNSRYKKLRSLILGGVQEFSVIELDVFSYHKTEVQTYIITGRKGIPHDKNIILKKSNIYGEIIDIYRLDRLNAAYRMDISYYKSIDLISGKFSNDLPFLGDVMTEISRGSKSNAFFKEKNIKVFHTTDFNKFDNDIIFDKLESKGKFKEATNGDILIPRVGTRCLNYSAFVREGNSYFTDCIYRIRAEHEYQDMLIKSLRSPEGILWRNISATGSCAKHLTINILKKMPIFFN